MEKIWVYAVLKGGSKRWELTGGCADAVIERFFVAAGEGAEGFVADSEENDGDEGEKEGCC